MTRSNNPVVKDVWYYFANTPDVDKALVVTRENGVTADTVRQLYSDEKLTKKVGTIKVSKVKLSTSKEDVPILDVVATITTNKGTIKYNYIRDNYKKITVNTIATSGIFTPGTITRTYLEEVENSLTRTRRLLYQSLE